ncbi:hypothetical protein F3Y22_tig00116964pilonHSYRG00363 [Hibiscus syriacus]|uniref:Uncharacterized protein n=1 Tax=Hibiscus syriacus TaxID=106335 RepID=A0A6A2XXQ8_HIBSY|nr:hypothetical protein F3Y22_tig00116964pilonHSYRG00363 [Hibiscus syriacus]
MVKAVVGEESQLQQAEDRLSQSSVPAQVGLVIGKLSSGLDRGFVYDLILTPQNDDGQSACSVLEPAKDNRKKGSKPKPQSSDSSSSSSLVIDKDWVAEHARQVSRMMVGGVKVIGIYVWASVVAFKNSTMVLCQTVKGIAEAVSLLEDDLDERLLIHICYSPRRWTVEIVVNDETCTTDGLHEVELLLPFMKDMYIGACSQKDVVGIVNRTGSVCSFSFLNSKEPISQAVADIKDDIIRSLLSRLDIICDKVDENVWPNDDVIKETRNDPLSEKPVSQLVLHSLRVFVPWLAGTFISDYLQPSETFKVLKDHCAELMSMEAPNDASKILELEEESVRVTARSFRDVVLPYCST